jgi:hypothetical protein
LHLVASHIWWKTGQAFCFDIPKEHLLDNHLTSNILSIIGNLSQSRQGQPCSCHARKESAHNTTAHLPPKPGNVLDKAGQANVNDGLVYNLHGLTDDEIKTVEGAQG